MKIPRILSVLLLILPVTYLSGQSPKELELIHAATGGDVARVWHLVNTEKVNPAIPGPTGETALHAAARKKHFDVARVILEAYPKTDFRDASGRNPQDYYESIHGHSEIPMLVLLRTYEFLRDKRPPTAGPVKHPSRVLILENTVNYLHPRLQPHYALNEAEKNGSAGVDDDGNGYVDDTYGWDPVHDTPYQINSLQVQVYLQNRETIGRILRIDEDYAKGRISMFERERRLADFTNPLAKIMGPHPDLTDGQFLNLLKSEAHGSHVAGIAVDAGKGAAQVQAVKVEPVRNPSLIFGSRTEKIILENINKATDLDNFLHNVFYTYLEDRIALGQRYSNFVSASGAGVANLSFGSNLIFAEQMVTTLTKFYTNMRGPFLGTEAELLNILIPSMIDFYLADAATWALVFGQNPNVLFVCAAGNENEDNDQTFGSPGYLARILPNVISVAAVDHEDNIASFSDYGKESVQIAALGQRVLSTVVSEADLYMDGTSMAAPAVAGTAALLRSLMPRSTVAEIRNLLLFSSRRIPGLRDYTVTSGVADPSLIINALQGAQAEKVKSILAIAQRAGEMPRNVLPEAAYASREFAKLALKLDPANVPAQNIINRPLPHQAPSAP